MSFALKRLVLPLSRYTVSSNRLRGKGLAWHVRLPGVTLNPEQPQLISFAHAVSLLPCLTTLSLTCYPRSKLVSTCRHGIKSFVVLIDEEVFTLRGRPAITALHLTNWSGDHAILNNLLGTLPPLPAHVITCSAPPSLLYSPPPNYPTLPNPSDIGPPARSRASRTAHKSHNLPASVRVRVYPPARARCPRGISCRAWQHPHSAYATNAHHGMRHLSLRTSLSTSSRFAQSTHTPRSDPGARVYTMRHSHSVQHWLSSAGRCARALTMILTATPESESLAGGWNACV